jgi:hypothetical protein
MITSFPLEEVLDFFAHFPCCFFGEGESEDLRRVDVFFFAMYAILAVMVVVPVPAPARISLEACVCLIASS